MRFRHYLAVLLALAALAVVAVGVYFGDASEFGAMTLRKIGDGKVEIHRGNEVIEVGDADEALEPQDLVVTGSDGDAILNLEEGRTLTVARKSRLRIRSTTMVEAQQGGLLATAEAPMSVLFDDVTARFSSAQFRLDRGFGSARAASYRGPVRLESPGEPRVTLRGLFQVDVAAGDLPQSSVPYQLSFRDPWDKQHLGDVVDLTQTLDQLATGFERQVGNTRPGLDYFSDLSSGNVSFMRPYMSRSVADLLVAFTIADNAPGGSMKRSFRAAFDYLDDGASYGVAATILKAKSSPLVAQLEELIVGTGAVAADGGAGSASFGEGSSGDSSSGAGEGDVTTAAGEEETVSGEVAGEQEGEVDDCSDVVSCGVDDVQDELPPGPSGGTEEEEDPPEDGGLLGGGGGGGDSTGGLLDGGLIGGGLNLLF